MCCTPVATAAGPRVASAAVWCSRCSFRVAVCRCNKVISELTFYIPLSIYIRNEEKYKLCKYKFQYPAVLNQIFVLYIRKHI